MIEEGQKETGGSQQQECRNQASAFKAPVQIEIDNDQTAKDSAECQQRVSDADLIRRKVKRGQQIISERCIGCAVAKIADSSQVRSR